MECRIVDKPAFRFAGVTARVPMQFEGENPSIARLAGSITEAQRVEMRRLMDLDPREVVNVSWDSDTNFQREEGELTHLIGVPTTRPADEVGAGLATLEAPAGMWAVFPSDGPFPEAMQQTTADVYGTWLATAPYELGAFRMFSFSRVRDDGTAYSEVWVPVRPRSGR
ncbi:MAG TPA: GyrI-like domain-containing protein [Candidatus Olsenella excrementavium]|uniref:GyrI-like domain-containing protein n=1 Tax=Candidatus Olsenella excrementavium TaxID=2838709 RepID=A0A9D2CGM7_9ACTN|nr:GyrI-like domain-containing protein [Candidatus Olsenella excrementavium]